MFTHVLQMIIIKKILNLNLYLKGSKIDLYK